MTQHVPAVHLHVYAHSYMCVQTYLHTCKCKPTRVYTCVQYTVGSSSVPACFKCITLMKQAAKIGSIVTDRRV